jgi:hypothetical protein
MDGLANISVCILFSFFCTQVDGAKKSAENVLNAVSALSVWADIFMSLFMQMKRPDPVGAALLFVANTACAAPCFGSFPTAPILSMRCGNP